MFFDEPMESPEFFSQQEKIAGLAARLLALRYDRQDRQPKPLELKKTGLFSRALVYPAGYRETLEELQHAGRALEEQRAGEGHSREMFWWNQDWEQMLPLILESITLPEEEALPDAQGWRREFKIRCLEGREGRQLLAVEMRGHWQKIASRRHKDLTEHSSYTPMEREAMLQAYNQKRNEHAMAHTAFMNQTGVHSAVTGWDYNTAFDYYTSAEYLSHRMRDEENYSQSLYTMEATNILHVSSESKDGGGLYALCEFQLDAAGRLNYMAPLDFARLGAWGEADEAEECFALKDPMILAAQALAEMDRVKAFSFALFPDHTGEETFAELLRQAGIAACLAPKLERS